MQQSLKHPLLSLALSGLSLLTGCAGGPPATGPTPEPTGAALPAPAAAPDDAWQLSDGELVIHVGKAGRLARLGHNHLVASDQLSGNAWLDNGDLLATVQVEVANLTVDDPERRAAYRNAVVPDQWADIYRSTPSAKNIADTRANMMGSKVLDAENFPTIQVSAIAPDAGDEFNATNSGSLNAKLGIQIKQHRVELPAILKWERAAAGAIVWESNFRVTHAELGMTPFSALGGALSVAEALNLEVRGKLQRSGSVQLKTPSVRRDEIAELDSVRTVKEQRRPLYAP